MHENFRFQPRYRVIKAALIRGDFEEINQDTFRFRPEDGQGAEAYLDRQPYIQRMDQFLLQETAVHRVDTFRYLLGNPVSVYAELRRVKPVIAGEDAGYILFEHPGGLRALFDGNLTLDHASDNFRRTMGEALLEGTGRPACSAPRASAASAAIASIHCKATSFLASWTERNSKTGPRIT